jgi:plasmid replication initiation protein
LNKDVNNLSDNQVATQHNDLIHGQQEFTLVQKRIFALAVQQISREDEDYKTYVIDISDLVASGTSRNIFSKVEKETENLMRKILLKKEDIENSKFPKTTRWNMISKAVHNPGSGELKISLHPDIRDMLLELKGRFTPVPVAELLACRSTYGQRMYELLFSQTWKGTAWEVSVDDLRFSLNVEKKYPNFSHFRNRILKKAQKDVKKHTNMDFEWSEKSRGKGRKITHLIFKFVFTVDQMNLALEQSKFDIYNLRDRLKKYAELSNKEIDNVMKRLKQKKPENQKAFAEKFHSKFQIPIDTNSPVGNGKIIQSPRGYFMKNYANWMTN